MRRRRAANDSVGISHMGRMVGWEKTRHKEMVAHQLGIYTSMVQQHRQGCACLCLPYSAQKGGSGLGQSSSSSSSSYSRARSLTRQGYTSHRIPLEGDGVTGEVSVAACRLEPGWEGLE